MQPTKDVAASTHLYAASARIRARLTRWGERTNRNSEIMALIGQYSASVRVLLALVVASTLVT